MRNILISTPFPKSITGGKNQQLLKFVRSRFDVAVKTTKSELLTEGLENEFHLSQRDLMKEGKTMAKVGYHDNIVNLQGVSAKGEPPYRGQYFWILDYCSN